VWQALGATGEYRSWWPWLAGFEADGLVAGARWRCTVRPNLPYSLRFVVHIDEVVPPRLVTAEVDGDIAGRARLLVRDHHAGAEVRLTSALSPRNRAFALVATVARPVLRRGHDWVLDTGARQFASLAIGTPGAARRAPGYGAAMDDDRQPRVASVDDAEDVARLLHDFNTEYDTPTPGVGVLAARLRTLLAGDDTLALVAGRPGVAVALVTLRPNVWYAGPVALLDELYVAPPRRGQGIGSQLIELLGSVAAARGVELVEVNVDGGDVDAQRFYERHGFVATEPGATERSVYYARELTS
jgi:GNAT superfamily N-acetyltransferase